MIMLIDMLLGKWPVYWWINEQTNKQTNLLRQIDVLEAENWFLLAALQKMSYYGHKQIRSGTLFEI